MSEEPRNLPATTVAAPAALEAIRGLPKLGEPGYTPEVHRQRTEAFARAYPAESDGREVVARRDAPAAPATREVDAHAYFDEAQQKAPGYQPPDLPGIDMTPLGHQAWDRARIKAAELGVSPRALRELAAEVLAIGAAGDVEAWYDETSRRTEQELRQQWSGAFGSHMKDARRAANHLGLLDLAERPIPGMPGKRLGDHPAWLRAMAWVGKNIPFDALPFETTSPSGTYRSQADAARGLPASRGGQADLKARIRELEQQHPLGQRTLAQDIEIRKLYERLYPKEETP